MTREHIDQICADIHKKHLERQRDRVKSMIAEYGDPIPAPVAADIILKCAASFTGEVLTDVLHKVIPEDHPKIADIADDLWHCEYKKYDKLMVEEIQKYLQGGNADIVQLSRIIMKQSALFARFYCETLVHESACQIVYPVNGGNAPD